MKPPTEKDWQEFPGYANLMFRMKVERELRQMRRAAIVGIVCSLMLNVVGIVGLFMLSRAGTRGPWWFNCAVHFSMSNALILNMQNLARTISQRNS